MDVKVHRQDSTVQRNLQSERTACLISTEPVTLSSVRVAAMIALKRSCRVNVLILNALRIRNKGHDYAVHANFRIMHGCGVWGKVWR